MKEKEIRASGVSPQLKENINTICKELGVEITSLFKIEAHRIIKEFDPKHRIDYGSKTR